MTTTIDRDIREQLYDPGKARKSAWLEFVKAHKNIRTAKGLLDLKAILKLYHARPGRQSVAGARDTIDVMQRVHDPAPYKRPPSGDMIIHDGLLVQKMFAPNPSTALKRNGYKTYAQVRKTDDVLKLVGDMADYDREYAKILHLDGQNNVVNIETIAIGSVNTAVVHPREVFKRATLDNSSSIMFVHNHPSGDPTPSREDIELTERLISVGKLMGIPLLDSVIVGRRKVYSFRETQPKLFDPMPSPQKRTSKRLADFGAYDPPKGWFVAMKEGIDKRSDVKNAAKIVRNIWARLSPSKKAEIKAKEKAGKGFKYDLPLPDDRPTKGTGTLRMVTPFKLTEVQVNLSSKDYVDAMRSGLFARMKRNDGSIALVSRCKSDKGNCNIFVDKETR